MAQVLAANIESLAPTSEQRAQSRRCLSLQVAGSLEENQDFNATVRDLSRVGFLMDSTTNMAAGEVIYVELPRVGRVSAQVAWTDGRLAGCQFLEPLSSGAVSAALLRALPDVAASRPRGPAGQLHPSSNDDFSSQHKMMILLGLSLLAWAVVAGVGYAAVQLFSA